MSTRIAYIGNFRAPFSTENHVMRSLRSLDVEVQTLQEDDWWKLAAMPENTPTFTDVDFVLWTHTHGYGDESTHDVQRAWLKACSSEGVPTIGYHLDRWWGLEREAQVSDPEPFFQQDLVITADGGHDKEWRSVGVNHLWMPPAIVADEIGRGSPMSQYRKDIGFVGGWLNYGHDGVWPWRHELVSLLQRRYATRFRAWPRGQAIRGPELNDLYASVKVLVGDSCLAPAHDGTPIKRYWSDRVPETLGRGGLLLHPQVEGLDEQFPTELPIRFQWGERQSLYDAIEYALALDADERDFLIEQAIEWVREKHTYRARMLDVIRLAKELRDGNVGRTQDDGGDPAPSLSQRETAPAMDAQPETMRLESSLHVTAQRDTSGDDDRSRER